ncbi:thiamine pyrophosphate-binding protein [Sphaerobacter thermophilus]|uniref:thiamine pyrophosphate-binding protein n=1 Tax=Sphaerobacter thermophilus TaxID=2057 RepID=UPI000DB3B17F|nr:MAG: acetolactate synthase [Sphaerobacter thermophilus]
MTMSVKRKVRGGVALIKALEAHGVRTTFGIPGVHTLDAYDALYDSDHIATILPRHEQGAGYMADGAYRATGKPGVALIVTGPGVTNVVTAAGEAFADSSRIVIIATNLERKYLDTLEGNLHEMKDQMGVMRPVTKWAHRVMSAKEIPGAVAEAFRQVQTGRGRPVYLEIPIDVMAEEVEIDELPVGEGERTAPNPEQVAEAADLIAAANRVFIFAGGGCDDDEVSPLLRELAHELGAPVCTSLMGKGAISEDDDYAVGAFGYRWSPESPIASLMKGSDLTIAIGTGLGVRTTAQGTMPLPTPLIHIDIDPHEIGRRYPTAVGIVADAALTLKALLEAVRAGKRPKERWSVEEIRAVREANFQPANERAERYVAYLRALREATPRDAIVTCDMTMMCYEAVRYFPVYEPRTFTFPRGFGTLGSSLPTALGAKIARPDRKVVSLNGDGGFQFTMQELGAAAHHRIPVTIVIFNDSTHTAVKVAQREAYPGRYIDVDLVNPDYVKLAGAYGITAVRAESPAALSEALASALQREEPVLIDVPIKLEQY